MKFTTTFGAVCCAVALFAACKKSENDSNKSETQKLLEAGKWQLSAATATATANGQDTTIDLYGPMDECDKDDFMQFTSDGKATMDENSNKCPGDAQVENATWKLLSNDTKLLIVDSNPDTMDLEISSAQMKLKMTKPNSSGIPITSIHTYKNIK